MSTTLIVSSLLNEDGLQIVYLSTSLDRDNPKRRYWYSGNKCVVADSYKGVVIVTEGKVRETEHGWESEVVVRYIRVRGRVSSREVTVRKSREY